MLLSERKSYMLYSGFEGINWLIQIHGTNRVSHRSMSQSIILLQKPEVKEKKSQMYFV